MIYKNYDKKSIKYFLYLVIICSCFLNSAYALNTTHLMFYSKIFLYIIAITLLILLSINSKMRITVDDSLKLYLMFFSFFIISLSFNFSLENAFYFFTIFLTITVAFMITRYIEFSMFVRIYIKVLKFLTFTSLIAWLIVNLIGTDLLPTITNSNGVTYYMGYFFFFIETGNTTYSNMSIFWEPGIFASFLLIALVFETCFKEEKESKGNVFLFIIGLISTQSSAGLALLALYFAIKVFNSKSYMKFLTIFSIVSLSSLIIIWSDFFREWLLNWNYDLFYKFFSVENATTGTRLHSPLINLQIFSESPLLGKGFFEAEKQYIDLMNSTYNVLFVEAQTSTSGFYFASIGIFGLIYTGAWTLSILKNSSIGKLPTRILILLIFLLIVNKEPHTNIMITYCILFYMVDNSYKYNNQRIVEINYDKKISEIV